MARERKSLPQHIKSITDRTVVGVFAVFGVVDSYDDRLFPGAFTKTIQERGNKLFHLWQHDFDSPAIATVDAVRELSRDELPPQLLRDYPEATGGMEVTRTYLDTERGNEILAGLKAGVPYEMSFAFDAIKYDFEALPGAKYEWVQLRNVREVKLYEISDVLWGANEATMAVRSSMPLPELLVQLQRHLEARSGARNSAADQERINQIAVLAYELGAESVALKAAPPAPEPTPDPADVAPSPPAEPTPSHSLEQLSLRLHLLDLVG